MLLRVFTRLNRDLEKKNRQNVFFSLFTVFFCRFLFRCLLLKTFPSCACIEDINCMHLIGYGAAILEVLRGQNDDIIKMKKIGLRGFT